MEKRKNPKGIRYNEEQMGYVMEKEKLDTVQKVVNFLLQDYWIREKIIPTITKAQNQVVAIQEKWVTPTEPIQKQDQFSAYYSEIKSYSTITQIKNVISVLKKDDTLTPQQKTKLELMAIEHSKNLYND